MNAGRVFTWSIFDEMRNIEFYLLISYFLRFQFYQLHLYQLDNILSFYNAYIGTYNYIYTYIYDK